MLRSVEQIRARTAQVPRGHALLQLAYAVMMAAYMAVFVYTGSIEAGASAHGGTTMALILPPLIISSSLITGASERFGGRLRTTGRQWLAIGAFIALLVVFFAWGILGIGYPWWMALIAFAVTLVLFSIRPLSALRRMPAAEAEQQPSSLLPRPGQITTIVLGAYLGLASAVALWPTAAWIVTMIGMLAVIVALAAQTSAWGILHTGYEWRRPQWIAGGVAALLMFLLAALIIATDLITPAVAIGVGVLVAASLIVSAFLPGRSRGASEA
ncbi:hypothetical protein FM104_11915 [Microbacterium esteraromaticum]|uniref:Uncharacterized protein n=2 Tax=Microbacterium esteraromaticum TaxID=57043 RepID=A0A1R4KDL3_9MICO|nr:hypothetical protein FM104_11915 [Microbacterium esteraromaticum]